MASTRSTAKPPTRADRALAAQAEEARLAALSDDERAHNLVARFGVFDGPVTGEEAARRLVAMGAPAVPALTAHLDDPRTGWQAALTLAKIGAPAARDALDAVRRHARSVPDTGATMWATQCLARLGHLDDVVALLALPDKTAHVARALAAVTPTSYAAIARCLDGGDAAMRTAMADALRPGRGRFFAVDPGGFDDALAGARSEHAMVRVDAALLLVDRAFPARERGRAVAELARLASDASAEVRRVTALSLGRVGKRHAAEARATLDTLCDDRVEGVRSAAEHARRELG